MECTEHKPWVFGPNRMTIVKLKLPKRTQPSSKLIMTPLAPAACTFMSVTGLNMKIGIQLKNRASLAYAYNLITFICPKSDHSRQKWTQCHSHGHFFRLTIPISKKVPPPIQTQWIQQNSYKNLTAKTQLPSVNSSMASCHSLHFSQALRTLLNPMTSGAKGAGRGHFPPQHHLDPIYNSSPSDIDFYLQALHLLQQTASSLAIRGSRVNWTPKYWWCFWRK